ncbi:RNA helicase [Peribacillus alkalitolerans]|uniref:RNA helicase n=1 Tax=Peribacillus alkalitolerans TaxID=1550385 RepID=UPI001F083D2C|nr:RNA helicase [Peribacillus alkalitolerans]
MIKTLTYYIDKGNDQYEPFYEYSIPHVGVDEFYARQLCTYFIMKGRQYELISNECVKDEEILVLKDCGENVPYPNEVDFRGRGIHVEIRLYKEEGRRLTAIPCQTHFEVIRYLLKDVVEVPGVGNLSVTSTEIDEDRGVYVLYVKNLDEED